MQLYNTRTQKKEEFIPHEAGKVKMYTCGPTVYHYAHIGNLRSYIMEDMLEKALRYLGYDVTRAMNITDVGHLSSDADTGEDKMLKGARREHKTVMQIAQFYTAAFFSDCEKLGIKRPEIVIPATSCIDTFIHMVEVLLEKGYAYIAGGNVYFDTSKLENYYVFGNMEEESLAVGVRDSVEEDVGFGPENMGVPTDEIWKRVDDSLKKTGMTAYRYQSPNKLSGGQKQRVAIAGVVAMRPSCIVLDEPTAMLDPNGRKEVLKAVSELNKKENVTVVLITHYMEEVIHANKVYVMDGGNVVMQGTPREIFSQVETLKKYRLDVPQVTLLAHELHKAGVDIPEGILTKEELVGALCR